MSKFECRGGGNCWYTDSMNAYEKRIAELVAENAALSEASGGCDAKEADRCQQTMSRLHKEVAELKAKLKDAQAVLDYLFVNAKEQGHE